MSSDGTTMRWLIGLVALGGVISECLAQDETRERACTGGVCVSYFLCKDGMIVNDGEGVIDKRFADNECPEYQVCCKEKVAQCTCVEFYQCLDDVVGSEGKNDVDLRFSEDECPSGKVCCVNVRPENNPIVVESSCKGKCVPFGQCLNKTSSSGALDLRAYDDCPSDQVCCESQTDTSVRVPKNCDGKCVPFYQCPGGVPNTGGEHLINLRSDESVCPGDQICCRERESLQPVITKASESQPSGCNGTCVPFYQCPKGRPNSGGQNLLNLRGLDDCPNDLVCCEAALTQEPTVPLPTSCKGSCVPFYQCPQGQQNTGGQELLNLRSFDDCPKDLVCCEVTPIQVSTEQASVCDGQCVPFYQCPAGSANTGGKDLLNLRSDDGACPGDLVCCKKSQEVAVPPPSTCKGSCVPFYQCPQGQRNTGGQGLLNLRSFDDCPKDLVCCEAPSIQVLTDLPSLCDGQCVPFYQCPAGSANTGGKGLLNLRSDDGACPGDLVCCKKAQEVTVPPPSTCKGSCVPFYQCPQGQQNTGGQGLLNLRSFDDCPKDLVCCEAPSTQVSTDPPSLCDGQCVPFYQCPAGSANTGGKDLLNLRSDNGACPGDLVCCKKSQEVAVPPPSTCKGSCVPFYQCPQGQRNTGGQGLLNLRSFDDCPKDLVCCEATLIPAKEQTKDIVQRPTSCQGSCVPFYQCPKGKQNTGGQGLLNLRSFDDCPKDLVCCETASTQEVEPPSFCDGQCVPFYQCPVGSANTGGKDLLNLRSDDRACPGDLVCCKKTQEITVPPPSGCKGTCVPFYQCPQGQKNTGGQGLLNLRSYDDCPSDLVCCETTPTPVSVEDPPSVCDGQCVPFYQCPAGSANTGGKDLLNLRSDDGTCPGDLVCCKRAQEVQPPTTPAAPKICQGQCVLSSQCKASFNGVEDLLNLRISSDVCPKPLVCCEKIEIVRTDPPRAMWMQWINDINGMKEFGSQPAKYQECGLQLDFNGPFARQREVPWLVTVWSKSEYLGQLRDDYHCVGTVIRSDVVLVPADCVSNIPNSQLYVRSGNYNLKATDGVLELQVKMVNLHPDYNFINGYANIALLTLQSTVLSPSEACLANHNEHLNEQNCLLVGWSSLDLLSDDAALPHKHRLSVQSCQSNLLCNVGNAQSFQNCASLHGSPLVCLDKSGQRWKLTGLVTKGSSRCDANAVPETLIRVNPLQPWINEQLSPSFVNKPAAPEPSRKYLPVF